VIAFVNELPWLVTAREPNMTVSNKDVARIKELLEEASRTEGSIADKARRIMQEMPHLTAEDIAKVAQVDGEEKRMEAAELGADAAASNRISEILREAEACNILDALEKLGNRAKEGDEPARELQQRLHEAMRIVGVSRYDDDDLDFPPVHQEQ